MSQVYKVNGTITGKTTKTIRTRAGKDATIHFIIIDGQPINVGFKNTHEEGEVVTLNVEQKYGEWALSDRVATDEGFPSAAPPSKSYSKAGPANNKGGFPVEKDSHAMSIVRQNSMGHAVKLVQNWHMTTEASTTLSLDDYYDQVLKIAYKITDFSTGHLEEKIVADMRKS